MRGLVLTSFHWIIISIIVMVVLVLSLSYVASINVRGVTAGTCGDGVCDVDKGENSLNCGDCFQPNVDYSFEHLVVDPADDETFTKNELPEYLSFSLQGREVASTCTSCNTCTDVQFYENATTCSQCTVCDPQTQDCSFCSFCENAKSDYPGDTRNTYNN